MTKMWFFDINNRLTLTLQPLYLAFLSDSKCCYWEVKMEAKLFLCWAQTRPIVDERWDFQLPITSDWQEDKHSGQDPPAQPALCEWPLGMSADLVGSQTCWEMLWSAGTRPCSHWARITQGYHVNHKYGSKSFQSSHYRIKISVDLCLYI